MHYLAPLGGGHLPNPVSDVDKDGMVGSSLIQILSEEVSANLRKKVLTEQRPRQVDRYREEQDQIEEGNPPE